MADIRVFSQRRLEPRIPLASSLTHERAADGIAFTERSEIRGVFLWQDDQIGLCVTWTLTGRRFAKETRAASTANIESSRIGVEHDGELSRFGLTIQACLKVRSHDELRAVERYYLDRRRVSSSRRLG